MKEQPLDYADLALPKAYFKGGGLLIAGSCLLAVGNVVSKTVLGVLDPFFIFGLQHLIAFCLCVPLCWRKLEKKVATDHYGLHCIRAVGGIAYFILMYKAIAIMNVVDATSIANATPLIVPLIARIWLSEKISASVWVGILAALIGVLFLLKPTADLVQWAALIALIAAIFSATAIVTIRVLSYAESIYRILFYYFSHSAALGLLLIYFYKPASMDLEIFARVALMGITVAAGQICLAMAYKAISPAKIAPLNYMGLLFTALLNFEIFGQIPDLWSMMGIVLIIGGGLIASLDYLKMATQKD